MSDLKRTENCAESPTGRRTAIADIAPMGEELSPSQLRTVSGGSGATVTGLRHSTDLDGDPMTFVFGG